MVEGTWSGYTSAQSRVVHRDVVSEKTAEEIRELGSIRYTDGTYLSLSVRECKPRERVEKLNGYGSLISDCLALKVRAVADIGPARERLRNERRAKDGAFEVTDSTRRDWPI